MMYIRPIACVKYSIATEIVPIIIPTMNVKKMSLSLNFPSNPFIPMYKSIKAGMIPMKRLVWRIKLFMVFSRVYVEAIY